MIDTKRCRHARNIEITELEGLIQERGKRRRGFREEVRYLYC